MSDVTMKQVAEIAQKATDQQQSTGPGKADQADKARFEEAMQADAPQQTQPVNQVDNTQQVEQVGKATEAQNQTQGSKILDNLDRMSADFKNLKDGVQQAANNHGEMGDLIRLQMQVAEVTTTQTLVGKGGEKSGQGVNQLVRGQ